MSDKNITSLDLRRFALIRLQFIEAMFIEHGFINRKTLVSAIGIESVMASRDLALYSSLNTSVCMNTTRKRWEVKGDFKPVDGLLHVSAADYLAAAGVVFGFKLGETTRTKTEFGVIK
ncbi:hypothetical protein [Enterobacter asburiae]|uniref:hypothetical protein n=1 Tax=Enterobacter asburiae TaxID=61645 RepID=UPI003F55D9E4